VVDLAGPLGSVDRLSLFESLERAAASIGIALFVVHVAWDQPPITIYGSALLEDFIGKPLEEIVGKPPWEMVSPAQRAHVRDLIASRGPGAPPLSQPYEIERPDGTRRAVEVGVARISTAGLELAICYFRDTTPLQKSEARFRSLVEHAPDGVTILQEGRFVLANRAALAMFELPDFEALRGRPLADFLPPAELARALERMAQIQAGAVGSSLEYRLINGVVVEVHSLPYEWDERPAILAFVRDVTERRRLQEQLFRGARLAALGTMAATVAHEINNPLTYLQLNLQRLEREAAAERDPARAAMLRDHLANAMHGVERVARIVRDLRTYSRDTPDEPSTPVDVTAAVERALQIVAHDLRHRARLVRRYAPEPAEIDGSAARLEQVVINLLVNALQSLDDRGPDANQITVEIEVTEEVRIVIGDTGSGLHDPDRVFEPFFTTKPSGEGTGLGLAVCKQLVEAMRGRIEILSTSDRGTRFAVTLPSRTSRPIVRPAPAVPAPGRRLRILVIDDEPLVRDAMRNVLSLEHDVASAGDGETALAMIADHEFDVILCDVMMPRMNGREVYEQVRARWPGRERRVVFVTGGAFVPAIVTFLESVDNVKLRKPFTIDTVLALVRDVSGSAASG